MKRLLLFAGSHFYPEGGWCDFKGSADDTLELKELMKSVKPEAGSTLWAHIVRASDGCILEEFETRKGWRPYSPPVEWEDGELRG